MEKADFTDYDVIIAGGGLAGLVAGILLAKNNFKILLVEKRTYPFHKVCGEYVSNEVLEFLRSIDFDPFEHGASGISRLSITDSGGSTLKAKLDLGGFGLSRYTMDHALMRIAMSSGVEVMEGCKVNEIQFVENIFQVDTSAGKISSNFVIGSYGKRDMLDKKLDRPFIHKHTGFMGVKYHIKSDYPENEIGLFYFNGGYCGIVKIEDSKYNLCYLYKRNKSGKYSSIDELEEKVLFRNSRLKNIFAHSEFISEIPEVINEISFDPKECVSSHILFCGDSAGLIAPLCGNGMAMAINGAVLLSKSLMKALPGKFVNADLRKKIEEDYSRSWQSEFSTRLFMGRKLQQLSLKPVLSKTAIHILKLIPPFKNKIIRSTHGKPLKPFNLKSTHQLHQTSHP